MDDLVLPRKPWWLLGTSVGQVVLILSGQLTVGILAVFSAIRSDKPIVFSVFLVLLIGLVGCGIASIVALRRHPEMQRAVQQRRTLGPVARRRYAVITVIGFGLAMLSFLVAGLSQASFAWIVVMVTGAATVFCFVQLGRPLRSQDVLVQEPDQNQGTEDRT